MLNHVLGNRYRIESLIGEGGMASVYRATDIVLDRTVAVKVLHSHLAQNEEIRSRFRQEAHALSSTEHPNIIKIYDFSGADSKQLWIVTEILKGATLADYVQEFPRATLNPVLASLIISEICKALAHAHKQGIVHRDVKPENIMVLQDGRIKLMDFGIAKVEHRSNMTMTGAFMGSPSYMSPEQIRGRDIDERSDIYSLGVMFYEVLTGILPFVGTSTPDVINKIVMGRFVPPIDVVRETPIELNSIVVRCLQSEPHLRYQAITEVHARLHEFLNRYGFIESHIELERYFKDRQTFDRRIKQTRFRSLQSSAQEHRSRQAARPRIEQPPTVVLPETAVIVRPTAPAHDHKSMMGTRAPHIAAERESRTHRVQKPLIPTSTRGSSVAYRSQPDLGTQYSVVDQRRANRDLMSRQHGYHARQAFSTGLWGILLFAVLGGFLKIAYIVPESKPGNVTSLPTPTRAIDPTKTDDVVTATEPGNTPTEESVETEKSPEDTTKTGPTRTVKPKSAGKPSVTKLIPKESRPSPVAIIPKRAATTDSNTSTANPPPAETGAITNPTANKSKPAAPQVGNIMVQSQPSAEIYIDGRSVGTTNDAELRSRGIKLPFGRHELELKRRGYLTFSRTLQVDSVDAKSYLFRLEKENLVRLYITTNAPPAKLIIEDVQNKSSRRELDLASESFSLNIPAGTYRVRVEKGSQVVERQISITNSREPLSFAADFKLEE